MKYVLTFAMLALAAWLAFQMASAPDDDGSSVLPDDPAPNASGPPGGDPKDAPPATATAGTPDAGAPEPQPSDPAPDKPPTAEPVRVEVADPLGDAQGKIVYREGNRTVSVFRHPRLVAELRTKGKPTPPAIGARIVREEARWRVWETPAGVEAWDTIRDARAAAPTKQYSPVYFRNASGHGSPRTLPGGVTVRFEADWDQARIDAFATEHGLKGGKPMTMGGGWYTFASAPGEAALRLAQRIQETGVVVLAKPDWAEVRAPK